MKTSFYSRQLLLLVCSYWFINSASAAQYWQYSTDNTYPVATTLDLSGMAIGATKVVSTDNNNAIQVRDDTPGNIRKPKMHCNDSAPAMSGKRISSGNPDYAFELHYQNSAIECRVGAAPFYRSHQNSNQIITLVPMKLVLIKTGDSNSNAAIIYPNFQLCARDVSTPDSSAGCWRGEHNGLSRYRPINPRANVVAEINKVLTVKGTDKWLNTGIDVKPGDRLVITAVGEWKNDGKPQTYAVTADGFSTYKNPGAVIPEANFASLIGRFGDAGKPFFIGSNYEGTSGSGRLFLQMNDIEGFFPDNVGELKINISVKS